MGLNIFNFCPFFSFTPCMEQPGTWHAGLPVGPERRPQCGCGLRVDGQRRVLSVLVDGIQPAKLPAGLCWSADRRGEMSAANLPKKFGIPFVISFSNRENLDKLQQPAVPKGECQISQTQVKLFGKLIHVMLSLVFLKDCFGCVNTNVGLNL